VAAANKRLNTAYLPKETFGQLRDYRRAKVQSIWDIPRTHLGVAATVGC
jgi:hypothetical protein